MPIREISRRTGVSRNTIRKEPLGPMCSRAEVSVPDRPGAQLDPYAEPRNYRRGCGDDSRAAAQATADGQAAVWRSRQPRLRRILQPCGGVYPGLERRNVVGCSRLPGGEASCLCRLHRVRLSSSTGARTSRSSAWRSCPSCRWRTSSFASRAFTVRAYLLQTHEMLFDAHNHAFRVLGGVPRRGIYDNMRTAVDKVGRGKERSVNVRFSTMTSHYLFEAEFCNPLLDGRRDRSRRTSRDARHRASGKPCPRSKAWAP